MGPGGLARTSIHQRAPWGQYVPSGARRVTGIWSGRMDLRPPSHTSGRASRIEQPFESSARHGRLRAMTDGHGFLAADLLDPEEIAVERSLRPRSLDEYLGQREVKAGLSGLDRKSTRLNSI